MAAVRAAQHVTSRDALDAHAHVEAVVGGPGERARVLHHGLHQELGDAGIIQMPALQEGIRGHVHRAHAPGLVQHELHHRELLLRGQAVELDAPGLVLRVPDHEHVGVGGFARYEHQAHGRERLHDRLAFRSARHPVLVDPHPQLLLRRRHGRTSRSLKKPKTTGRVAQKARQPLADLCCACVILCFMNVVKPPYTGTPNAISTNLATK